MLRLLFNAMAALSLLIAMAVGVLWIRVQSHGEGWRHPSYSYSFMSDGRGLVVSRDLDHAPPRYPPGTSPHRIHSMLDREIDDIIIESMDDRFEERDIGFRFLGVEFWYLGKQKVINMGPQYPPVISAGWSLTVPHWLALLMALVLPALWVWNWRRSRAKPGHCAKCGYDLRGNRATQTCPECGTAIVNRVPPPAAE